MVRSVRVVLVLAAALVLAIDGPLGLESITAAATTTAPANQEARLLARNLASLPPQQQEMIVRQLDSLLKAAGVDLRNPRTQAQLAESLGLEMVYITKAVDDFKAHKENPQQVPISLPIALLFVAAGLIFIPAVFRSIAGTLFGEGAAVAGVDGIEAFK